jgi:NSS family neurotransmitter:Na+ symporter
MATQRAQWTGRLGFILAAAGSAIGLGNLWKFPYITYENNGGAFVLVYLAAIAVVGAPIMLAEILLGRRSQKNAVGAFRELATGKSGGRAWLGVGVLGVTTGFVILSYYSVVAGWTLRYILMAVSGQLGDLAHHPGIIPARGIRLPRVPFLRRRARLPVVRSGTSIRHLLPTR